MENTYFTQNVLLIIEIFKFGNFSYYSIFEDLKRKLKIKHEIACLNHQLQFWEKLETIYELKYQQWPDDGLLRKGNI